MGKNSTMGCRATGGVEYMCTYTHAHMHSTDTSYINKSDLIFKFQVKHKT